jgi:DNA-binding YbaB/EbfC family protein
MDIMGMMKKAEELKSKMAEMQDNLAGMEVDGAAGAGLVKVTLTGKGEMKRLSIDPSLFKEDQVEILEDLIITAHNEAKTKAEAEMNRRMADLTAGLPLPPGMKLPF